MADTMIRYQTILILILMSAGSIHADTTTLYDVNTVWTQKVAGAIATGKSEAEIDFSNRVYRIKAYGLGRRGDGTSDLEKYMATVHSIRYERVAGCTLFQDQKNLYDSYNQRMMELLNEMIGKDVFTNAYRESIEWKKAQQEAGVVREPRGGSRAPQP